LKKNIAPSNQPKKIQNCKRRSNLNPNFSLQHPIRNDPETMRKNIPTIVLIATRSNMTHIDRVFAKKLNLGVLEHKKRTKVHMLNTADNDQSNKALFSKLLPTP
jgi:hypothetical protein